MLGNQHIIFSKLFKIIILKEKGSNIYPAFAAQTSVQGNHEWGKECYRHISPRKCTRIIEYYHVANHNEIMGHRKADAGKFTMDALAYSIRTHRSAATSQQERIRWAPQDAAASTRTTPRRILWKTKPESGQASGSDYMLIGYAGGKGCVGQEHGDAISDQPDPERTWGTLGAKGPGFGCFCFCFL